MKRMKRFLGLLLCGILTLSCLVSCGESKIIKAVSEEIDNYVHCTLNNFTEEGYDTSANILEKIYKDSAILCRTDSPCLAAVAALCPRP